MNDLYKINMSASLMLYIFKKLPIADCLMRCVLLWLSSTLFYTNHLSNYLLTFLSIYNIFGFIFHPPIIYKNHFLAFVLHSIIYVINIFLFFWLFFVFYNIIYHIMVKHSEFKCLMVKIGLLKYMNTL